MQFTPECWNRGSGARLLAWGLAALCLAPAAVLADGTTLLVEAIDVEGGAATLYITPEHRSLLIDSGWTADTGAKDPDSVQRIVASARRHGLSKLDYVLITHYHLDHVGGLPELLSQFPVGTIFDHGPNRELSPPGATPASAPAALYPKYIEAIRGHEHRTLKPGDTLSVGSLHLTVVTSDGVTIDRALPGAGGAIAECANMKPMSQDGGEENARSVGVVLTFGRARIAALGDLTWNMENKLVCPRDKVGPVDLLIVSHHGSSLSNSPALLHALAPRVAIEDNGAQKGGDVETYETVSHSPRLQRLWQLHFAERAGPEHNVPATYIANPSSTEDAHASLEVTVANTGTLTVTNERTGSSESYQPAAVGPASHEKGQ
jgi:beta-lactamase superfamily II metal-dependent hydrolase